MSSLPLPLAAFVAGIVSFLSPCVLPLVPGYVSLISGSSVDELRTSDDRRLFRAVMRRSFFFVAGFSVVFIAMGAAATTLGQMLLRYRREIAVVAGVIIVIFGLHLTGLLKIKALYADKRLHSLGSSAGSTNWGSFLIGFAFAFGWTPCIGPILAVILTFAASQDQVMKGVLLLAVYSLGLAVPFLLTSLGIDRFLLFYARFRRHLHTVEVVSGIFLIIVGILIGAGKFTVLNSYLGFLNRFAL